MADKINAYSTGINLKFGEQFNSKLSACCSFKRIKIDNEDR